MDPVLRVRHEILFFSEMRVYLEKTSEARDLPNIELGNSKDDF